MVLLKLLGMGNASSFRAIYSVLLYYLYLGCVRTCLWHGKGIFILVTRDVYA